MSPRSLAVALVALGLAACGGGAPRDPYDRPREEVEPDDERPPARPAEDPWSVDAMLPRSGDPARPNVKVEVVVLDVASRRDLQVRASLVGAVVRGVVDLRASLSASAGSARSRSRSSSFIVVQAGNEAEVALTDESRGCVGTYQSLWVNVVSAGRDGVVLDVAPVSPTARPGESIALVTRVTLGPGQAVLLGGASEERQADGRGAGRYREAEQQRELVALLRVDVLD